MGGLAQDWFEATEAIAADRLPASGTARVAWPDYAGSAILRSADHSGDRA